MSNAKRTPDEPGRGSVATGQQPAKPKGGNGASVAARPGAGAGNGRGTDPSTGSPAAPVGGAPDPAPDQAGSDASKVTGSDIAATSGVVDGATAAAPPTGNGASAARPDETATAQFRVPPEPQRSAASEETATPGAGATAVKGDRVRASEAPAADSGGATAVLDAAALDPVKAPPKRIPAADSSSPAVPPSPPVPPSLDSVPAPAVPAPGPGAAQPPPWRRMPGHNPGRPDRAPSPPADRLLDEGPTAFLEGPRYPQPGPDGARNESGVTDTGSWTRIPRSRPPRQAALQLKRLDPWSVLKLALVLAVVLFFIWLVAVGVLYGVLDGMGVWDRLNGTYADLVSGESPTGNTLISAGRVFGLAAVVGAINSLLFAVAVTVGAFVYNVSADLVGGIEVTLSERD